MAVLGAEVKNNNFVVIHIGEKMDLTIAFHYPEEAGNETQELELSFELCADAVQTKNNPEQQFE